MSTEFDYARAHRELAFPEWEKLPAGIKALYKEVIDGYEDANQLRDLSMPWLPGFREKFDAVGDHILNKAQGVIHALGHWDSPYSEDLQFPRSKHGAHWKFQRLARQSLSGRNFTEPYFQLDTARFYVHKPDTEYTNEEMSELFKKEIGHLFSLVKVDSCNFRVAGHPDHNGHPFCIGRKHLENSNTMMLDPRCAPCEICGCDYDDHEHDTVLFVTPDREIDPDDDQVNLTDEEKAALQGIVPTMKLLGVDGFAFVR